MKNIGGYLKELVKKSNLVFFKEYSFEKVIGISTLKESSSGATIKNVLDDKLFSTPQIKQNLIGITHDNASSFVGRI